MTTTPRVLILGGGFAALETAFLLRARAHDSVEITIVSDRDEFLFRPNTIYIPFGAEPEHFYIELAKPLRRRHIALERGTVAEVDPATKRVTLADSRELDYDKLVVTTGAGMSPEEIPGLETHAATIWTPDTMLELRRRFVGLREKARAGSEQRVLFLVPPNNKCAGPLYEIAFMLETWLRREGVRDRVQITYSTYESTFIQAFGPRLHEVVVAEFGDRGIAGYTNEIVTEVTAGQARYADDTTRDFDLLVAFPPYVAAMRYETLPSDDRGFLQTDPQTRQVAGHPDIYAPGDTGDFPVKQAFLALLQSDSVAEHIAARIADRDFATPFDPVSMCVMEMFDKAAFAQVPLEVTGDPTHPVRVRPDADGDYKVGVSPLWRLGKKILGFYLPMRFDAGEPFHAGAGWKAMEVGLKGMAGMLAD